MKGTDQPRKRRSPPAAGWPDGRCPAVSVIIPSRDGSAGGNVPRLKEQIGRQTLKPFEVIVVTGVSPNGRARNTGVREAKGEMLILIDDSVTLGGQDVFYNLLAPFRTRADAGMTGASVLIAPGTDWLGRRYAAVRGHPSAVVTELTDSDRVQHGCCAIPTRLYKEVGWESDDLITGTDDDLRQRVRAAGYRLYLVPGTRVYHHPPGRWAKVLRKAFTSGLGSAYALRVHPGLFGRPLMKPFRYRLRTNTGALLHRTAAAAVKTPALLAACRPVAALHELLAAIGFAVGWFRYGTVQRDRP